MRCRRTWHGSGIAEQSLGLVAHPIERFELAGTLNDHPGHARADEAKKDFPAIFALAVAGCPHRSRCAAAAGPPPRTRCWPAKTYRTGNPIDEWFFVPQAGDRRSSTPPTTPAPSSWPPSTASRSAAPTGRDAPAPGGGSPPARGAGDHHVARG